MKSSKGKLGLILMAFVVLALMSMACSDSGGGNVSPTPAPTVEPTPEVITGEETLDEIIVETQAAVETTVTLACKACLAVETAENCTGFCGSGD